MLTLKWKINIEATKHFVEVELIIYILHSRLHSARDNIYFKQNLPTLILLMYFGGHENHWKAKAKFWNSSITNQKEFTTFNLAFNFVCTCYEN